MSGGATYGVGPPLQDGDEYPEVRIVSHIYPIIWDEPEEAEVVFSIPGRIPMTEQVTREGYGEGYDEREALRNWLSSEQFKELGIGGGHASLETSEPVISERVRKPKVAKRAHVETSKQVGSRQWKTMYNVSCGADDHGMWPTQAEAIKAAKEISLEERATCDIEVIRILVDSEKTVAVVTPGNSRPGKWHFEAMFNW
jgi:hypothetical protein